MPTTTSGLTTSKPGSQDDNDMIKYGIMRVPVDYFHFGEFRYTSLREALAQARLKEKQG